LENKGPKGIGEEIDVGICEVTWSRDQKAPKQTKSIAVDDENECPS
jgi:hypothetical protein